MNIIKAIELANKLCDIPVSQCLALYRYLLLSEKVDPLGDNELGFELSEILQHKPVVMLEDLSYSAREMFTQLLFGNKDVPREGAIGVPAFIISSGSIPYGPPESSKLNLPPSQDGELLNRMLLERYNGKAIGFREIWNQIIQDAGLNKRRDPNVFIMAIPDEQAIPLAQAVITIGEPKFVLVLGDESLFEKIKTEVSHVEIPHLWLATPETYQNIKKSLHETLLSSPSILKEVNDAPDNE